MAPNCFGGLMGDKATPMHDSRIGVPGTIVCE
jgi:hypothetical protein